MSVRLAQEKEGAGGLIDARLTMTFLLPPVFFVIFIALVLAVVYYAATGSERPRRLAD